MRGRIPEKFIDDLLARVDIVDVIQERVPLKKAGRDWSARCPFHDERSPSFTVSPAKQFYHCFGCGAHGSAIGFLMNYDRLEFPDAVEELASRARTRPIFMRCSNRPHRSFAASSARTKPRARTSPTAGSTPRRSRNSISA